MPATRRAEHSAIRDDEGVGSSVGELEIRYNGYDSILQTPNAETPEISELSGLSVPFRIIGEALNTYIIAEYQNIVWFIDKHAAHERIHFDALRRSGYEPMSQALITPVVCRLGYEDASTLLESAELLENLGFTVESFGDDAVAVRRIPAEIEISDAEPVLSDICAELKHGGMPSPAKRDGIYRAIACKAAIKAGKSSDIREMEALAARVLSGEIAQCPHGRPVAFELTKAALDRSFKRA
jgi:DNA mismatch repair protein MutL